LRGNDAIAFAKVEMQFQGANRIGADAVLVVLRRENSHWRAFSVSSDLISIEALQELIRIPLRPGTAGDSPPPVPRLLNPNVGARLGEGGRSFEWEIASGSTPLAAQIGESFLDDEDSSWPLSRICVFPAEPRRHVLQENETTAKRLAGPLAARMSWCIWAVGIDGRISASEVRSYRRMEANY
jgi:hypothetical protein